MRSLMLAAASASVLVAYNTSPSTTFFNQALGATDVGALRNLYNESICMAYPEEIADMLRPFFAK